ncbi:MAG TPA: Gldg family protein [Allosphingosinicella sp.]|nr:Gldg family protein [Allosphingosinicella sp.]
MPIKTSPIPPPPPPPRPVDKLREYSVVLAAASGAALVELLAGLFLGAFPLTDRAEALPFLLYRPWAVLLLALLLELKRIGWRARIAAYVLFLLLAGGSEALAVLRLGNPGPWPEMLRGWGAGAAAAAVAEAVFGAVRPGRRRWIAATAAVLAVAAAAPPVRGLALALVEPSRPPAAERKPAVMLMTALPMVWGEGGAFDPGSRPAALYTALQQEFEMRPIDALDSKSLAAAPLLLLVQPRWLAPDELVALDAWVRGGGRALILTDPRLVWPSDLPAGDIRRPPPSGLLKPLLDHWGLALEPGPPGRKGGIVEGGRRIEVESEGRLRAAGADCRRTSDIQAECRIGRGRATILADADLVRDDLWVAPHPDGALRHRRVSDNPLIVADLLDRLGEVERPRLLGDARWRDPAVAMRPVLLALLLGMAGLTLASALAARLPRRR